MLGFSVQKQKDCDEVVEGHFVIAWLTLYMPSITDDLVFNIVKEFEGRYLYLFFSK